MTPQNDDEITRRDADHEPRMATKALICAACGRDLRSPGCQPRYWETAQNDGEISLDTESSSV